MVPHRPHLLSWDCISPNPLGLCSVIQNILAVQASYLCHQLQLLSVRPYCVQRDDGQIGSPSSGKPPVLLKPVLKPITGSVISAPSLPWGGAALGKLGLESDGVTWKARWRERLTRKALYLWKWDRILLNRTGERKMNRNGQRTHRKDAQPLSQQNTAPSKPR